MMSSAQRRRKGRWISRGLLWGALTALALPLWAAAPNAAQLLRQALRLDEALADYTARVIVTMDLPGLQVPRRTATIYFKRPDRVAVKSRGVVIIPRRALLPNELAGEITKNASLSLLGMRRTAGVPIYTIKVMHKDGGAHRWLLSIRGDRFTLECAEIFVGARKEMTIRWTYQRLAGRFWLPQRIEAILYNWPGSGERRGVGHISVIFVDMRVNSGLSDALFEEKGGEH